MSPAYNTKLEADIKALRRKLRKIPVNGRLEHYQQAVLCIGKALLLVYHESEVAAQHYQRAVLHAHHLHIS